MAKAPFKHLYGKLRLSKRSKPRKIDERVDALEEDLRDLRSTMREILEAIERELGRDIDRDKVVGRVSPKRPLPKTARLATRYTGKIPRPKPLGPNLP
jgi:hypothetical protein